MEIRLCDYLRHQVPHIFERDRSHLPSSTWDKDSHSSGGSRGDQPYDRRTHAGTTHDALSSSTVHGTYFRSAIWSGKLARNGNKLVDISAVVINGQCELILSEVCLCRPFMTGSKKVDIINITHRLKEEEATKSTPVAVFYLRAQHSRDTDAINEYIEYFQSKNRIGVAPLEGGNNIYICAPGTEIYARYTVDNQHHPILICILVQSSNAKPAVPPVPTPEPPVQPKQGDHDWLSQLNTITAMLGTNK
ncbi:SPOC domain containing protein [Babesia divergens]|uniref:SPOC domain containing protein n=1 Tax=Babesia divergens TaxID=32595 RepID=A0AAD9LK00_BABDI|nr:SPOC domain containing protein [Babesia divergens]